MFAKRRYLLQTHIRCRVEKSLACSAGITALLRESRPVTCVYHTINSSVPARPIYEGAAPCPYCLAPCPIYTAPCPNKNKNNNTNIYFLFLQNVIAVFVFSDSRCKNACKMLADLCPYFHQSPTKFCPGLVSFACWIVTKFWSFTSKSVPYHLRS